MTIDMNNPFESYMESIERQLEMLDNVTADSIKSESKRIALRSGLYNMIKEVVDEVELLRAINSQLNKDIDKK